MTKQVARTEHSRCTLLRAAAAAAVIGLGAATAAIAQVATTPAGPPPAVSPPTPSSLAAINASLPAANRAAYDLVDANFDRNLEKLKRYLRQPGYSATGEGIRESAKMTLEYIRSLGSDVQLVETPGNPIIFGYTESKNPKAKTLIIYSMYDLVPIVPKDWAVPPMATEVVQPSVIGQPDKLGPMLVARGAHNQRGPFLGAIFALQAMKQADGDLPFNIIWVVEGEEEIKSPSLSGFIREHIPELMKGEAVWSPAMRQDPDGVLMLYRGSRGTRGIRLRAHSGDGKDIWPALSSVTDAPLQRLVLALGTLMDKNENLTIDGVKPYVYDASQAQELDVLKNTLDFEALRKTIGIPVWKNGQSGRDLLGNYIFDSMMTVTGITGPRDFSIMPMDVSAKLDFRLAPNIPPDQLASLLRRHLDAHGFTDIEVIDDGGGYPVMNVPTDSAILTAAKTAAKIHNVKIQVWPARPGVGPTSLFAMPPLNKAVSEAGLGYGINWHIANEAIAVEGWRNMMKYTITYLKLFAAQ
jgi:acetylornithine deacetylase/succinyl-diaminopimelate desuccinylase-like protein